jgi:hypothetical protein
MRDKIVGRAHLPLAFNNLPNILMDLPMLFREIILIIGKKFMEEKTILRVFAVNLRLNKRTFTLIT